MRLAFVNHGPLSEQGGAEKWIVSLSGLLASRGHTIDVYTPAGGAARQVLLPPGVRELPVETSVLTGLRTSGLGGYSAPVFSPRLVETYDLVYSTSIFSLGLFRRSSGPLLIGTHDAFVGAPRLHPDTLQALPLAGTKLLQSRRQLRVHTLNPAATARFRSWGFRTLELSPDFLLTSEPPPPTIGERLRLVHLGRINRRKGADLLLALAARLEGWPDVELSILGPVDAPYVRAVQATSQLPRVHFQGFVSEDEKARVLAQSDVALFLSARDSHPLSPLECLASGLPVVSTWRPLAAIVQSTGVMHVDRTLRGLSEGVGRLREQWRRDPTFFLGYRRAVQRSFREQHDRKASELANVQAFESVPWS